MTDQPVTNGCYIKAMPDESLTGVSTAMLRLCASVSGQIYAARHKENFNLSTNAINAEVVHFEDHGELFKDIIPNMTIVVSGQTMILGWQGTSNISNTITDIHVVPASSHRWAKRSIEVKAHGGFLSVIENDLTCLEATLIDEMKKRKITEIITTGHSLGGALAQVAHLCIQGELANPHSVWSDYKKDEPDFIVRTVAFSPPMSISAPSSATEETKQFLFEIASNATHVVYHMDIVPRLMSALGFVDQLMNDLLEEDILDVIRAMGADLPLGSGILSFFVDANDKLEDKWIGLKEGNKDIIALLETYKHYGNIIFYETDNEDPTLKRDYEHEADSNVAKFSEIQWKNRKDNTDVVNYLTAEHNFIIRGPGLSYNIPEVSLAATVHMMDGVEIQKGYRDAGSVDFKGGEDLINKVKESFNSGYAGAVASWKDKNIKREDKFNDDAEGTLFFKKDVPATSEKADVDDSTWWTDRDYKATFWRVPALNDLVVNSEVIAERSLSPKGVVELKKNI